MYVGCWCVKFVSCCVLSSPAADTPHRQYALGKVIDGINRSKADRQLVDHQKDINDERYTHINDQLTRHENELTKFREIVQ